MQISKVKVRKISVQRQDFGAEQKKTIFAVQFIAHPNRGSAVFRHPAYAQADEVPIGNHTVTAISNT